MLYFKTKKGRLIIQVPVDENQYVHMLICPPGDERVFGHYDYVNEIVWGKFRKISEPQILEENDVDCEIYYQAIENENASQQEIADFMWVEAKAYHL